MSAQLLAPSAPTLAKYGLTVSEWRAFAQSQGGACAVCRQVPSSGRLHIDHEHVRGWGDMTDRERAQHVRGLLCFRCNTTYVGRSITIERAQRVVEYLQRYSQRRVEAAIARTASAGHTFSTPQNGYVVP